LIDLGAAYGTAKSGVGITSMGVLKPELIFKSIIPVIMAGILGIYGLIISLLIFQKVSREFDFIKLMASDRCNA
jgi:V-type H+-transporting ATPase proteolipid subunit